MAGCSNVHVGRASSTSGPSTTGPPPAAHLRWSTLAATLERPAGAGRRAPPISTSRQLYNERFDGSAPAAIAYCRSASDVQRCVAFAREHGVQMAARSGGHSYGGYSSCPGLVIDVTQMAASP